MQKQIHGTIPALVCVVMVAALSLAPVADAGDRPLTVTTQKAPVAPDGVTAGALTDFLVTFRDLDPDVRGIGLGVGGTIEIVLPDAFTNTGAGTNTGIILQGWPQSPPAPPPAFIWTTETFGNTIRITLNEKFRPGQFGPGPKTAHLLLFGFTNPELPGVYPVDITIKPRPKGHRRFSGRGHVRILPDARPSVDPISLFSGPPGPPPPFFNPIYQTVALGEPARQVGLYLWDGGSAPFVGVDLSAPVSNTFYRLMQGSTAVGDVFIKAPEGANDFLLESVPLPPGGPPSVSIGAFVTGVPVGLLGVRFTPDPMVTGDYEIAIGMRGGNETTLFVTVEDDQAHNHDDDHD